MGNLLNYGAKGCDAFCDKFANAYWPQSDGALVKNNIKVALFNASTLAGITAAALLILGIGNPPTCLCMIGISLLGREITRQSMLSVVGRATYSFWNWKDFNVDHTLRIGKVTLFYDFTPSISTW